MITWNKSTIRVIKKLTEGVVTATRVPLGFSCLLSLLLKSIMSFWGIKCWRKKRGDYFRTGKQPRKNTYDSTKHAPAKHVSTLGSGHLEPSVASSIIPFPVDLPVHRTVSAASPFQGISKFWPTFGGKTLGSGTHRFASKSPWNDLFSQFHANLLLTCRTFFDGHSSWKFAVQAGTYWENLGEPIIWSLKCINLAP